MASLLLALGNPTVNYLSLDLEGAELEVLDVHDIVATSEYIGEPIKCEHGTGKIDEELFTTYCWIHGSKKIDESFQKHFECKANVVSYWNTGYLNKIWF